MKRCAVALLIFATACTTQTPKPTPQASSTPVPSADEKTVWLCRPGLADNPCTSDLTATAVSASRSLARIDAKPAKHPKFDCFYVYPTVSMQRKPNADLTIEEAETSVATAQASRFSTLCDVWAPMYRQRTLSALFTAPGAKQPGLVAYDSLLGAWRDYLTNHNHGRPFVLIGHSQGAVVLTRLVASEIDADAQLRERLVSALLIGANVEDHSFKNVPPCRAPDQVGCVVAFSSFFEQPPSDSLFGITGQGVSLLSKPTGASGAVLCTNPANLAGGSGALVPFFPTPPAVASTIKTPWVAQPDLYKATCRTSGGATWLDVDVTKAPGDQRLVLREELGRRWGLHRYDVNIALGNLVGLVREEERARR